MCQFHSVICLFHKLRLGLSDHLRLVASVSCLLQSVTVWAVYHVTHQRGILNHSCWNFMITGMWISHLGYLLFSPASRQSSRRHYIACDNLCTHKCTYIEKHLESNEYLFLSEFHDSEIAIAFSSRLKMRIQKAITLYTHNDETTSCYRVL